MPEPSKCPNRPKASTAKNTQAIQMPKPPIPPRPPVLPKPHKPPRRSDRPNTRTAQTPKQPVPSKPPKRRGDRSYPNRPDRLSHPYHPNAQAARPYDETTCPNAQPPRPELPERTEYPDFPTLPPPVLLLLPHHLSRDRLILKEKVERRKQTCLPPGKPQE